MNTPQVGPNRIKSIGLEGIVAADTRLSHVDGAAGQLIIGGYELEVIAGRATFEEVCYLLWHGRLPNQVELATSRSEMQTLRELPPATLDLLRAAARARVPPMDALRMGAATLSLDDPATEDQSQKANLRRAQEITARAAVIIANYVRLLNGLELIAPRADLSHAANYLYMLTGEPPHPEMAGALETYLVTVVDHGMNASTFAARVIASTRSDMYSAITGAVGALKGPLHGGAPGPVLDMLREIGSIDNAETWLWNELSRGRRIMGFGHRIYRVRDPRADVLSATAARLAEQTGERGLYDTARELEQVALKVLAAHRPERRLQTNVEFYTALVLHMVGLSSDLFTPTFAAGRVAGWTAHVLEQLAEGRLIRPSSDYTGPAPQKWVPVEQRP